MDRCPMRFAELNSGLWFVCHLSAGHEGPHVMSSPMVDADGWGHAVTVIWSVATI